MDSIARATSASAETLGAGAAAVASVTPITAAERKRPGTPRRRRSAVRARPARTAFVLSGGASLAALQPGMLTALYELDIKPDLLVATSAGAINATFVASRPQTVATARALGRIWRGLQRDDVFPVSPYVLAGGLLGKRDHLVSPRSLRKLMERHVGFTDLADAPIPLHVVAFDLATGAEVLFSEGPVLDVVCGSAAVPGVFPPVQLGERRLIDGGVVNNTPISHAVELGAERVYVLPAMDRSLPRLDSRRSALSAAIDSLGLMMRSRLEADVARFSEEVELIVLPAPNPLQVMPTDFSHADRLLRDGLQGARRQLAEVADVRPLRRQAVR
jgi:NTE family protein